MVWHRDIIKQPFFLQWRVSSQWLCIFPAIKQYGSYGFDCFPLLPQAQLSTQPMCDFCLHWHGQFSWQKDKARGRLKVIDCSHMPLTSHKICNVDIAFDGRSERSLSRPHTVPRILMISQCGCEFSQLYALVTSMKAILHLPLWGCGWVTRAQGTTPVSSQQKVVGRPGTKTLSPSSLKISK